MKKLLILSAIMTLCYQNAQANYQNAPTKTDVCTFSSGNGWWEINCTAGAKIDLSKGPRATYGDYANPLKIAGEEYGDSPDVALAKFTKLAFDSGFTISSSTSIGHSSTIIFIKNN